MVKRRLMTASIPDHELLERRALVEYVQSLILLHRVTLICAPAGYGKTTLAKSVSGSLQDADTASILIDRDTASTVPLFTSIFGAMFGRDGGAETSEPVTLAELLFRTGEIDRPFVLLIDDFHWVTDADTLAQFARLVERMAPDLHLVLISRSLPAALPLSRWRVSRYLAEITTEHLRLNAAEVHGYLQQTIGLAVDAADLARLLERTEGWMAGLQLLVLALRNHSPHERLEVLRAFSGEHRTLFDYLTGEVLNKQPEHRRSFLLETCFLEQYCAPLCNAVTGRDDAQRCLDELTETNAFIRPLDESALWYRPHPLFRDALLTYARREYPNGLTEGCRRAADWYIQNGSPAKAAEFLLMARDHAGICRLLEVFGDRMWTHQEMLQICAWTAALPDEVLTTYPRVMLLRAWALIMTRQLAAADQLLDAVQQLLCGDETDGIYHTIRGAALLPRDPQQALASYAEAERTLPEMIYNWQGALWLGQGFAWLEIGDLLRAERAFSAAVAPSRQSGNLFGAMYAVYNLGRVHMAQGALQRATATFEYALELAHREPEPMRQLVSWAYLGLAEVEYERNDLPGAIRHVLEAVAIGKRRDNRETIARGYLLLARIEAALGQADRALQFLYQADRVAFDSQLSDVRFHVQIAMARQHLAQGDVDGAEQLRSGLTLSSVPRHPLQRVMLGLLQARILMAQGKISEARQFLQPDAAAQGSRHVMIELALLLALNTFASNHISQAAAYVRSALSQSRAEKFCRIFLDEGHPLQALLVAVSRLDPDLPYVNVILSEFQRGSVMQSDETERALIEPISRAEMEILALVARGLSNQQIADERSVSLNTVKWHLKNLYGKLDVRSRSRAVARARALRLI